MQVNSNGVLSFGRPFPVPPPVTFPIADNDLIFPLWADINLWEHRSAVFFRQTTDPVILDDVRSDLHDGYYCSKDFIPSWVFIVTWHNVTMYREEFSEKYPVGTT